MGVLNLSTFFESNMLGKFVIMNLTTQKGTKTTFSSVVGELKFTQCTHF